jgi:oxygen-dependent protoporphyrinogen oxidase
VRVPANPSGDGAFYSLPGGLVELVDAILARLDPSSLRLGATVHNLVMNGGFVAETSEGEARAPSVILTTPTYVAADLVAGMDSGLARILREIRYASSATLALGYRREQVRHPLLGSGFVVPRVEGLSMIAASWVSSKWSHRAPEDHVLLRAFIGGARDPEAMRLSDDEMRAAVERELGRILGIRGEPVFTRLYRWERANAQHEVGHLDRIAAIERRLAALPGLHVTGSGFRGVGIPDCIADARKTASAVAATLG